MTYHYFGDPTTDEGCLSGHYWGQGGSCSRCGLQLRCGACGRFTTVADLTDHIDNHCPVTWDVYEDDRAVAPSGDDPLEAVA